MSEIKIEQCKMSFECPMKWSELLDQGVENQRYCPECKEQAHWCKTQDELLTARQRDWCVAFKVQGKNKIDDHTIVGNMTSQYDDEESR